MDREVFPDEKEDETGRFFTEADEDWEADLAESRALRRYFPHLALDVEPRESDEYPTTVME